MFAKFTSDQGLVSSKAVASVNAGVWVSIFAEQGGEVGGAHILKEGRGCPGRRGVEHRAH